MNDKYRDAILDYAFNMFYESRIESLIESQWEAFAQHGHITGRNYVFAVSYEH